MEDMEGELTMVVVEATLEGMEAMEGMEVDTVATEDTMERGPLSLSLAMEVTLATEDTEDILEAMVVPTTEVDMEAIVVLTT